MTLWSAWLATRGLIGRCTRHFRNGKSLPYLCRLWTVAESGIEGCDWPAVLGFTIIRMTRLWFAFHSSMRPITQHYDVSWTMLRPTGIDEPVIISVYDHDHGAWRFYLFWRFQALFQGEICCTDSNTSLHLDGNHDLIGHVMVSGPGFIVSNAQAHKGVLLLNSPVASFPCSKWTACCFRNRDTRQNLCSRCEHDRMCIHTDYVDGARGGSVAFRTQRWGHAVGQSILNVEIVLMLHNLNNILDCANPLYHVNNLRWS